MFYLYRNKEIVMNEVKLFKTDFVRLIDGEIVDGLDTIYAESSIEEMLLEMKDNGHTMQANEKYVAMTSLREDQQKRYIEHIKINQYE